MFPCRYYGGIDIEAVQEELCAEKSLKKWQDTANSVYHICTVITNGCVQILARLGGDCTKIIIELTHIKDLVESRGSLSFTLRFLNKTKSQYDSRYLRFYSTDNMSSSFTTECLLMWVGTVVATVAPAQRRVSVEVKPEYAPTERQ